MNIEVTVFSNYLCVLGVEENEVDLVETVEIRGREVYILTEVDIWLYRRPEGEGALAPPPGS